MDTKKFAKGIFAAGLFSTFIGCSDNSADAFNSACKSDGTRPVKTNPSPEISANIIICPGEAVIINVGKDSKTPVVLSVPHGAVVSTEPTHPKKPETQNLDPVF